MNICIVGASRGLGRELCRHFLKDGHHVWGIARSREGLEEIAHDHFQWTQVDLINENDVRSWENDMASATFQLDVIVLNASVQLDDMENGYDHTKGDTVLQTGLDSPLHIVSLFLPDFLARKSGQFVAIASTAALRPSIRSASYAASKAGLTMAFRTLRLKHRKSGVRFQTVMLGPIQTDMWEGKKSALVPSASSAAAAIAHFVYAPRHIFYYPVFSTWLLRLSLFLPDRIFASLSSIFLK